MNVIKEQSQHVGDPPSNEDNIPVINYLSRKLLCGGFCFFLTAILGSQDQFFDGRTNTQSAVILKYYVI